MCKVRDNKGVKRGKMAAERVKKEVEQMSKNGGYKTTNSNTQDIKAPNAQSHNPKGTVILRGTDLRTGGKKK